MSHRTINPDTLCPTSGYSHIAIVEAGRQIHISGQVALDARGQVVGKGDVAAQTEQVYRNLEAALTAAGSSLANVFKTVMYVVALNPDKVAALRSVRTKVLGAGPFPASTMVGVTALAHPDLLVEIEVIAHVG